MKFTFLKICFLLFILFSVSAYSSDTLTPVGRWRTFDSKTAKPKSIIGIVLKGDTLVAFIDSLYREPGEVVDSVCDKCSGWRKGKPMRGLIITDAMVKHGNRWSGGSITDPDCGKVFNCIIKIQDSGKILEVRGFIGIPLAGRSQHWRRIN